LGIYIQNNKFSSFPHFPVFAKLHDIENKHDER
jgi:hypothetical protein